MRLTTILFLTAFLSLAGSGFAHAQINSAGADNCGPETRLDQQVPDPHAPSHKIDGSMMHVPVLDQGQANICYAYAAAQMTQSWMCSHNNCNSVSPMAIAIDYTATMAGQYDAAVKALASAPNDPALLEFKKNAEAAKTFGGLFAGGDAAAAMNSHAENQQGYCKTENWASSLKSKELAGRERELLDELQRDYDLYQQYLADQQKKQAATAAAAAAKPAPVPALVSTSGFIITRPTIVHLGINYVNPAQAHPPAPAPVDPATVIVQDVQKCLLSYGIGSGQERSVAEIQNVLKQDNPLDAIEQLVTPACYADKDNSKNTRAVPVPPVPAVYKMTLNTKDAQSKALQEIKKQLQRNQPINLTLNGNVMYSQTVLADLKKDAPQAVKDEIGDPAKSGLLSPKRPDDHSVLIIGERKDPKRPGKCQFLVRNSWGAGNFWALNPDWDDEGNGEYWMDSSVLLKTSGSINYFDESVK